MKKIIKHYPMTDRLIVRGGYISPLSKPQISKYKKKTKKADENLYCCAILINTGL
jgi:hypothetical protein